MSKKNQKNTPLRRRMGILIFTIGLIGSMIGYRENILQNKELAHLMLVPLFCFLLAILILQSTWDDRKN